MRWIAKLFLWFQIRSLEILMDGRDSIRPLVTDPLTRANMDNAQDLALSQLRKLKREYAS